MRLFEDGSERGGALISDLVAPETASDGWDGDGERVGVSMGADREANSRGLWFSAKRPTPAIAASSCP